MFDLLRKESGSALKAKIILNPSMKYLKLSSETQKRFIWTFMFIGSEAQFFIHELKTTSSAFILQNYSNFKELHNMQQYA